MQTCETPHSELIENAVFATFLMDPKSFSEFGSELTPEHFYQSRLSVIYAYMQEHNCADITVLCERFKDDAGWIMETIETIMPTTNLCHHIDVLNDYHFRRKVLGAAHATISAVGDMDRSANVIADELSSELYAVRSMDRRRPEALRDILPRVFQEMQNSTNGIGVHTGLIDVDSVMGPMCAGELVLVAARPAMGKSSLALNIVRHNAIRLRVPVLVFTLEMSKTLTGGRVLFSEAMANYERGLQGNRKELEKVQITVNEIMDSPIYIDDTPAITMPKLIGTAKALHKVHGIKLVIVDHIQLIGIAKRGRSRNEEVSEISAGLKTLARSLDIPVVALSQLSRECERRDPPEPMLSDLRDSGALEQDADKVLMLYRPEEYNPTPENKGKAFIIVAKNRNGRTGKRETVWDGEHMQFVNAAKQDREPQYYDKF